MFLHVSVSLSTGAFCMSDLLSGCLIPYSLEVGLCPWFHVPCLSKGFSVQGDLCPGVAVQESGSLSRESLSRGLSPGEGSLFRGRGPCPMSLSFYQGVSPGGLCPGKLCAGVFVQGVSVQESLSKGLRKGGLYPGGLCPEDLCSGVSVLEGSLSWRSLQRPPESEKRALPILLECFLLL